MSDKLTASEAVYGFCEWLTTREEKTTMSAKHDIAIIADLVSKFCADNNLEAPRDHWEKNLKHPSG